MNELKVVARLMAQERGEAVRLTQERAFPLSDLPLVMVPIVMAGESPTLFALGVGDGVGPCRAHVCAEPRNRDEQYAMLVRAAADMERFLQAWAQDAAVMPQIITSSRDASRMCLAALHRMTYAPQPELRRVGRQLHWLGRLFEQVHSASLLDMPAALSELYATGQDEHADAHLGAVLEWTKPADGQIYDRILRAEQQPASTSTDPQLDNDRLVPLVEALGRAEKSGDTARAASIREDIAELLGNEVERRYGLIGAALRLCRGFPASDAADHIQQEDRNRHDRNLAYVADPESHLAAGLSGNAATAEFLSRELNANHVEQLMLRSVSSSRSAARLSGDVLRGEVVDRDARKNGNKTIITYQVRTAQERLPLRRGDKLTPVGDSPFTFGVTDVAMDAAGDTTVTLQMTAGMTKSGQPQLGARVELAEPLSSPERIARTMGLAHDRLRTKPVPQPVNGPMPQMRDYLTGVRALRSDT